MSSENRKMGRSKMSSEKSGQISESGGQFMKNCVLLQGQCELWDTDVEKLSEAKFRWAWLKRNSSLLNKEYLILNIVRS